MEEMRIKLASLQEELSEHKTKIAEKTSDGVNLLEKISSLESDNKDLHSHLEKSKNQNEIDKQEIIRLRKELEDIVQENKKTNDQLLEANRRLDEAYSRFDLERSRAERAEKELKALQNQINNKS